MIRSLWENVCLYSKGHWGGYVTQSCINSCTIDLLQQKLWLYFTNLLFLSPPSKNASHKQHSLSFQKICVYGSGWSKQVYREDTDVATGFWRADTNHDFCVIHCPLLTGLTGSKVFNHTGVCVRCLSCAFWIRWLVITFGHNTFKSNSLDHDFACVRPPREPLTTQK